MDSQKAFLFASAITSDYFEDCQTPTILPLPFYDVTFIERGINSLLYLRFHLD